MQRAISKKRTILFFSTARKLPMVRISINISRVVSNDVSTKENQRAVTSALTSFKLLTCNGNVGDVFT